MTAAAPWLIIFTRYPEPGRCKTRLISHLGPVGAAALTERLTRHVLSAIAARTPENARSDGADQSLTAAAASRQLAVELYFDGGDETSMRQLYGDADVTFTTQPPGDLGERLRAVCARHFAAGAPAVLCIGTDCPALDAGYVQAALKKLESCDVVLGPAWDGGYVLIGLSRPEPALFEGIDWGTERVLSQTLAIARLRELNVAQLPALGDVDIPDDLPHLQLLVSWSEDIPRADSDAGEVAVKLSIIIPAKNEAGVLPRTLDRVRSVSGIDLIVVDGGSTDATANIARSYDARVVTQAGPRGVRLNAGAVLASGEQLLFLHADALLPLQYDRQIEQVLADRDVALGAFPLAIESAQPGLAAIARAANWRSRELGLPYGDQGLFVRAAEFWRSGGFPPLLLMDDYAWVWKMRRRGQIRLARDPILVSARRWEKLGVWQTTLRNQLIVAGYWLGIPPEQLAAWYRRT